MINKQQHWQDWLTGIVGIWLILSPWIVNFTVTAVSTTDVAQAVTGPSLMVIMWNFILSGAVAVVLAIAAITTYRMWEEWVDVALGIWLVVSPWVLNFAASQYAVWNAVLGGVVIILAAGWNLIEEQQASHA